MKNNAESHMKLRSLVFALVFFAMAGAAHAQQEKKPEFRFAAILGDNMVLQQQKQARVWGWAKPGADVADSVIASSSKPATPLRLRFDCSSTVLSY